MNTMFDKVLKVHRDDRSVLHINMRNASYVELRDDKKIIYFGGKIGVFATDLPDDPELDFQCSEPPRHPS